jgi:WD40 repeat protein
MQDTETTGDEPSTLTLTSQSVQAGQRFGPYRVVRLLGQGGMGVVYLAEQEEPIRRRVALKLIKLGMDSREVIARFESERQALALMDHPNIARVFDAGVSQEGRPYFVMEYVPGVPITKYCDAHQLTNRQRLELFRPVCMAIQHAHQKGIIHRDIKPSNILVAAVDGQPTPKVIDFGVAKATNQRLTEKTVFTQLGFFVGTPEYISPEQAELTSLDVDTTTDIYSLGVVLYELLVGVLPFDAAHLRKAGYDEIRRILREEEPLTPTARLNSLGATATKVAERRHTDTDSLEKELRGDLDWITMKAMEKDQMRRYPSASEFAADIGRYLRDEPVLASPPNRAYRIRKFIRRHRQYVAAGVSILFCLLLGLAVSTAMFFKAESARREAERQGGIARHQSYVANLIAADLHLRSNEIAEARRRLFSCPKDLRNWEWRHLFLKSDFSVATLYTLGDSDEENLRLSFAFSTDGSRIYSNTQHTLYSWDAATFLPVARWSGFGSIVAIAPHAEKILSKMYTTGVAEADHTLHIFDPFSHRLIATFPGHQDDVTAAAFSPDGARLVTGDGLGVLFLWDAASGRPFRTLTSSAEAVITVAFSPDGKRIVTAFRDNTVRLWDAATGVAVAISGRQGDLSQDVSIPSPRRSIYRIHIGADIAVAFSPDSKWLAAASGKSIRVWESVSGRLQRELNDFDWPVRSLAFSRDGTQILAGTDDGVVQIRDGDSGKPVANLVGHEFTVRAIAFHSGHVLTADRHKIRVWDGSSFGGVKTLLGHENWVTSVAFSPNGRYLASASDDSIRVWDASSGKALSILKPALNQKMMGSGPIAFSPDSTYLASVSAVGTITIWDIISGAPLRVIKIGEMLQEPVRKQRIGVSHPVQVTSIGFSPDGDRIASGSTDGTVRFWEVATGRLLSKIVVLDRVNALGFSPDGRRIVTGTGDPSNVDPLRAPAVRVWDVESGKLLVATKSLPRHMGGLENFGWASAVVYSHDGSRIASLQNFTDGPVIWDANSGTQLRQLKGPAVHFAFPLSITFHPDGRRLFASCGNLVQIWDADSGEPLLLLHGHDQTIQSIALSEDGGRLASGARDGLKVWDTHSVYDPEAESLVQSLFNKLHFANDVAERLRTDPSLNDSIRKNALLRVQQEGEHDPAGHIQGAWEAAKAPGAARAVYELALRRARVACKLAPWNWEAFNSQGAAQYRLGAYRDALSSLFHAAELRVRPSITNLAFQTLTYHVLGESTKARSALAEAKRLLERPDTMMEPELVALVLEAGAAVEGARR